MKLYKITSEWTVDNDPMVNFIVATDVQEAWQYGRFFRGAAHVASIELVCSNVLIAADEADQPDLRTFESGGGPIGEGPSG